jgi:cytidylate kinase
MAIITISREMGSGGIPLAQQLAEKMSYNLVNGTRIRELAASYDLNEEAMRQSDEKAPIFIEELDRQSELNMNRIQLIVLEQALKGNVILYGRGGQDLLASVEGILRVRVIAPFEERVENWAEREWIDPERARSLVRKSDQQRDNFIRYYFDRDGNDPLSYDLTVNTSRFPIEAAVEMIEKAATASWLKESTEKRKARIRDLIIQKKIQVMRLADERILDIWYDIEVEDGYVTLSGPVYSDTGHQAALEGISEIEGVSGINDQLKVVDY